MDALLESLRNEIRKTASARINVEPSTKTNFEIDSHLEILEDYQDAYDLGFVDGKIFYARWLLKVFFGENYEKSS